MSPTQLDRLVWRSDRIRLALTLLYLAMAMFVGTSLTMAIHVLIGSDVLALPTALAIGGVTLLLVASVQFTREAMPRCGAIGWRSISIKELGSDGRPSVRRLGRTPS